MTTIDVAYDTVLITVVQTAWDVVGSATAPYELKHENTKTRRPGEQPTKTANAEAYGSTFIRTLTSPQETQGVRRFQTDATLTVSIYTPLGDGHTLGQAMGKVMLAALRGHTGSAGGVWFFDIVFLEIGERGPRFQYNVNAGFRYQETV